MYCFCYYPSLQSCPSRASTVQKLFPAKPPLLGLPVAGPLGLHPRAASPSAWVFGPRRRCFLVGDRCFFGGFPLESWAIVSGPSGSVSSDALRRSWRIEHSPEWTGWGPDQASLAVVFFLCSFLSCLCLRSAGLLRALFWLILLLLCCVFLLLLLLQLLQFVQLVFLPLLAYLLLQGVFFFCAYFGLVLAAFLAVCLSDPYEVWD